MADRLLKFKRRIIKKLSPTLVSFFLKILYKTIRWDLIGKENIENIKSPLIFSFFHGRMMMLAFLYNIIRPKGKIKMILSPHFDGEVGSLIAKKLGIDNIKGSSSKGSLTLLKQISQLKNSDIGITPDGPRGPYQKVKSGVVYISKVTGFPIIPIAYSVKKGKALKSWDRFLIPRPFTRGVYVIGKPLYVPSDIDKDKIDVFSKYVEEEMIRITNLADKMAGLKV